LDKVFDFILLFFIYFPALLTVEHKTWFMTLPVERRLYTKLLMNIM